MKYFDLIGGAMVQVPHGKWVMRDEAASNTVVATPSASDNSDYATAFRIYKEYLIDRRSVSIWSDFLEWCKERLNPAKAPDCA